MGRSLLAAVMLFAIAAIVGAQSPEFLAQLQRVSHANDRQAIAAMIRYPITIAVAGLRVPFKDAAALLERYDDIFTPALRESIARGTTDVTVEMADGQWRITSITVPRAPDAPPSALVAPAVEATGGGARKQEPRRVAIRVGPRPTQIPGLLARGATDVLILYLPKARLASVRLERVPAGAAVIRVVHASTGAPLGARTSADGRFVSGRPPASADYRIEVRRTDSTEDAHMPYTLSLSLR